VPSQMTMHDSARMRCDRWMIASYRRRLGGHLARRVGSVGGAGERSYRPADELAIPGPIPAGRPPPGQTCEGNHDSDLALFTVIALAGSDFGGGGAPGLSRLRLPPLRIFPIFNPLDTLCDKVGLDGCNHPRFCPG